MGWTTSTQFTNNSMLSQQGIARFCTQVPAFNILEDRRPKNIGRRHFMCIHGHDRSKKPMSTFLMGHFHDERKETDAYNTDPKLPRICSKRKELNLNLRTGRCVFSKLQQ